VILQPGEREFHGDTLKSSAAENLRLSLSASARGGKGRGAGQVPGFRSGNALLMPCTTLLREFARFLLYSDKMQDWLDIPKDRKRLPIGRLCLVMGVTALLGLALLAKG
jgi:hypothetical protein